MAKWVRTVGPHVLSSTTEQKLGEGATGTEKNFKLPSNAKSLLAIRPICDAPEGKTATEAVMAYVTMKSDSNNIVPYTVLCAPIGSTLGVDGLSARDLAPVYPVNLPVIGGTEIEIYANGLINHTIEPYVQVDLLLSNFPPRKPKYKAKIGTLTTMGAATAGNTNGSGITLENWTSIEEVTGFAVGTTVAAAKGICGKFMLTAEFNDGLGNSIPYIEFAAEPVGGAKTALDAAGTPAVIEVAHLTRVRGLDVNVGNPITVLETFYLGVALTTAGKFIVGVLGH